MKSYDYRVRQFILSFAIICLVWFAAVPIFAQDGFAIDESVDHDIASEAWPGQYIVAFDSAQNVEAANTQLAQSGDMVQEITACGTGNVLQVWNVDESVVTAFMEIASAIPSVRYIEPNWVVRSSGISTAGINVPTLFNDTYYRDYQWPLQHSRFEEAWQFIRDEQMTSRKVRVAVIDSGVDFGHPDLSGRLLSGVNYITPGTSPNDDFGHGTHITGIIAAIADNGLGIAGGVPEVEIDPLKMLGSNGSGSIANLVQAICDAANRNATVINMSLEVSLSVSLELVQEMQSAVDYAYLKGSLLVAAAGNTSGGPVLYPARLNHVIAVAGVTTESTRASYNPIGSALDIAAGGGDLTTGVLSTWPSSLADKCAGISHTLLQDRGSTYCTQFGTSGAAAHVSAGAAVLRSIWHNISVTETETFLESSAHDLGLAQNEVGAGLLDIEAAARETKSTYPSPDIRLVSVVDEDSRPVTSAEVFWNGQFAGATNAEGRLALPALAVGDQLVARWRVLEQASPKKNHMHQSGQNWAYRLYITSMEIPGTGIPVPFTVANLDAPQVLTVRRSNTLIGFNIVASVEWDADEQYLGELEDGMLRASAYLYHASNGQMLFERVSIFDNNQYMADADYQIRASNQELPRANVGGLLDAANLHVYLGRYFNGNDANSGSWLEPDGFRTQIHEFGHYGLFLQDSYFYYDFVVRKVDGNCTSLAIRTNSTPLINATLMDYQYNAAQFSMRDISGLWSVNCEKTRQWQVNKRSDWETISDRYRDQQSPQRWTIRTPADRGGVVPGPTSIPINSWFSVAIADNTEQNVCGSLVTAKVSDGSGNPAVGVDMTLRKTNRVIVQGKTDADGQITVLGAANGDRLVANGWGQDLWINATTIICSVTASASNAMVDVVLEPAPFGISTSVRPGNQANRADLRISIMVPLSQTPMVNFVQSGATSQVAVPVEYDALREEYSGTVQLDGNLSPDGSIVVYALDAQEQSAEVVARFSLASGTAGQDELLMSSDGQAELFVPAGSLSFDGAISIQASQATSEYPDNMEIVSGPYTIYVGQGVTLNSAVNLAFRYLDMRAGSFQFSVPTARIYRWNEASWLAMDSTVSENHSMVSVPISEFGTYVLMAEKQYALYMPVIVGD